MVVSDKLERWGGGGGGGGEGDKITPPPSCACSSPQKSGKKSKCIGCAPQFLVESCIT